MKLLSASILLCALVLSSFGHDLRSRSHHADKVKKAHHHDRQSQGACLCPCECTTPGSSTADSSTSTPSTETPTELSPGTSSSAGSSSSTSSTDSSGSSTEPSSGTSTEFPTVSLSESSSETTSTNPITTSSEITTTTALPTSTTSAPANNNTLTIYINATDNVVAVVNVPSNVALVLDINNNLAALFNGSSGAVIIFNYGAQHGFYISGGSSISWNASQESFQSFFARLDLKIAFNYARKNGRKFTTQSIGVEVSLQITNTLRALGVPVSNNQEPFKLWADISNKWSATLRGPFKKFLTVIGSGATEFRGGILRVVAIFQGLRNIIERVDAVNDLIRKRVHFEFSRIVNAPSSVQAFIYVVTVLSGSYVNLNRLRPTDSVTIFDLIGVFSGNAASDVDGAIIVIGQFIALAQRRIDVGVFIDKLFAYYRNSNNASISIEVVSEYLLTLRNSARDWGWAQVVEQIDFILQRRYIVNGVDIYTLIVILIQPRASPLQNISQILVVFLQVVEINQSFGELFLRLVTILRSENGQVEISILLGIKVDISGKYRNVLSYVLSDVSVNDISGVRQGGGDAFYQFLIKLRIFGQIITAIDGALGSCSHLTVRGIFTFSKFQKYINDIVKIFIEVREKIYNSNDKYLNLHHKQDKSLHQHLYEDKHVLHHSKHLEHSKHDSARKQKHEEKPALRQF